MVSIPILTCFSYPPAGFDKIVLMGCRGVDSKNSPIPELVTLRPDKPSIIERNVTYENDDLAPVSLTLGFVEFIRRFAGDSHCPASDQCDELSRNPDSRED